jgi:hypothetical protein
MAGFNYNDITDIIEVTGSLNVDSFGLTGSLLGTSSGNLTSASFVSGGLLLFYGDSTTSSSVNFSSGTFEATASNAITSSYVDITGSNIIVRYNDSQIQLTGSTTASHILPLTQSVFITGSSVIITGSTFRITSSTFFGVQSLPDVNDTGSTFLVTYNTASGQFHYLNENPPFNFTGYNSGFGRQLTAVYSIGDAGIITVGEYTTYGGIPVGRISVLDLKGNLSNFPTNVGSGFNINLGGIATANGNDGYVVAIVGAGTATYKGSTVGSNQRGPFKLTLNGDIDPLWNPGGTGYSSAIWEIVPKPNGGYIFSDAANPAANATYNGTTVRGLTAINNDGTLNTTLQTELTNRATSGYFNRNTTVRACPDGKIVAWNENPDLNTWGAGVGNRLAVLNADGTVDTTFNTGAGTGPNANISQIAVIQTGSAATDYFFLITGFNGTPGFSPAMSANLTTWNGIAVQDIFAVERDGTIRSSFNQMNYVPAISSGQGRVFDPVKFILINNMLYAYGNFTTIAGQTVGSIARFDLNGNFDNSFNVGGSGFGLNNTQFGSTINTLFKHDSRNEIWAVGGIVTYNGISTLSSGQYSVVRISYDGQIQ